MSGHWWLALRCAAWVVILAIPAGASILYFYGVDYAGAFWYGVGAGVVSFVSTALTVSLLRGRSKMGGIMVGAASFGVRYGFAAGALGIPAYFGLWPAIAMFIGFGGVYLAETLLVPWVLAGDLSAGRAAGYSARKGMERRVEA